MRQYFVLIIFVSLFLFGCSGEHLPPNLPKLYSVTLTIVQDGKPFNGASVVIVNENYASSPWAAGGVTNEQGQVKLRTEGKYSGAPAGKYKVTVTKVETPDIELTEDSSSPEYNKKVKEIQDNTFYLVEDKFTKLDTTPLRIEITPSEKNFELDVSPAVRKKYSGK
ncbi:MAG: carboxypeptidase-like regulatory domain-containing protein [Planctomycetaceae bacterium]|nr:carboxypeptidase-like regulatory domain-containing protein [Planctomycetaceae bacterium]